MKNVERFSNFEFGQFAIEPDVLEESKNRKRKKLISLAILKVCGKNNNPTLRRVLSNSRTSFFLCKYLNSSSSYLILALQLLHI